MLKYMINPDLSGKTFTLLFSILFILIIVFQLDTAYSQPQPKIINQPVTPHMMTLNPEFAADSTVATGLNIVAKGLYVYLSAKNIGYTSSIQNTTWTFMFKPSGSNATIISIPILRWIKFRTDIKGLYEVKVAISTSTGNAETTIKIFAGDFVGVGNFSGVPAAYPNCMVCHAGMPVFLAIFNKWKESGHANLFRYMIDSGSSSYSTNCMKCHTTGYDHNIWSNNHGFDDVARSLRWKWTDWYRPHPGVWDSLKLFYPSLVAYASIGCENCHGAGSEHATGGASTSKIQISIKAGTCGSCHDQPWKYNKYAQWENSKHNKAFWYSGFAQGPPNPAFMTNNLDNCIRCHDGWGFVNLTKNIVTNTKHMTSAQHRTVTCATCHNPHGETPTGHQLRTIPADTLANGVHYGNLEEGKICVTCHMARRDVDVYTQTVVSSSHWGPHHSTQGDVLIGTNAGKFYGFPYLSGSHRNIDGGCVGCHMAATTDTGTVTRDKVGGHSWNMHYEASNYDHIKGCLSCHTGVTSFDDFIAPQDFDGDNTIEPWQDEVDGCITNLRKYLPPVGLDSVNWQLIAADTFNVNLKKSYWNYQLIKNDGSRGMHNPFFAISVLIYSAYYPTGITQNGTEVPANFEMSQNYPNPFNPFTKIDFSIPRSSIVTIKIYDITGREVKSLVNQKMSPGKYKVDFNGRDNNGLQIATGIYFYRFVASGNVIVKKMLMIK